MGLVIQKGPLSTRADSGLWVYIRTACALQDKVLPPRAKNPSPATPQFYLRPSV
ncbi:MAG: hypothetical protein JWM57_2632, partial [Phycisphaerales bacterium]|nr:hypothetical protein [Phycisphaerales bacterium]